MPYLLPTGRTVTPEMSFELNDIQYPPNYLKYTTEEERSQMGITWVDPEPEVFTPPAPVVPQIISDRQFYQRLAQLGFITLDEALAAVGPGTIPSALVALVDALPTDDEKFAARMLLVGATQFDRSHQLVGAFAQAFGWTSEQLDTFWIEASAL